MLFEYSWRNNMNYETFIKEYSAMKSYEILRTTYKYILRNIDNGVYIWGTGRLGKYVNKQCDKNGITIKGFIDNDIEKQANDMTYSVDILQPNDIVIIASLSYVEIARQINNFNKGINHIYYEVLAKIDKRFEVYYPGFVDLFEEIEENKQEYTDILSMCTDKISYEVLGNILMYRMTLDSSFVDMAYKISIQCGKQDFDKVITDRINDEFTFCDVGGYDGTTTEQYLQLQPNANKVFFFEPDRKVMEKAQKKLQTYKQINYINAAIGEKNATGYLCAIGGGASTVAQDGDYEIKIVSLDQYVQNSNTYIKMDIEGYEEQAIVGAENAIRTYRPLLGISLYHLPGDIHKLTRKILSYHQDYRLYVRHYTLSYADTLGYFV